MLTYEDCVGLTGLEADEIEAIAQHEHIPEIVAAEMGCCLACNPDGELRIVQIIREDIAAANEHHHDQEALHWKQVLTHFNQTHHLCEAA